MELKKPNAIRVHLLLMFYLYKTLENALISGDRKQISSCFHERIERDHEEIWG